MLLDLIKIIFNRKKTDEELGIKKVAEFDLQKENLIAYNSKTAKQLQKGLEAVAREQGIKSYWTKNKTQDKE